MGTFYRGFIPQFQLDLNNANNGKFLGLDNENGEILVENLAQSIGRYEEDSYWKAKEREMIVMDDLMG